MLNTHQSQKRNSWKYTLVIPALIGFILLFQIKTIAQEKESDAEVAKSLQHREEIRLVIDKNVSEAELKAETKRLKEEHGITLKYSKIKRNGKGEITAIKVEYKDKNGNKGVSQVDGKEPIAPIHFYKNDEAIGFGRPKNLKMYANVPGVHGEHSEDFVFNFNDSLPNMPDFDFDIDIEVPEAPEAPETSFFSKMPDVPERLTFDNEVVKIVIKKDGQKPLVILDGEVIEGDESILSKEELDEIKKSTKINKSGGEETQIIINGKDVAKFRADAMANAKVQIGKQKEMVRIEMARAKEEIERARPEIERAKREMELSKPEIEKAKAEMEKARAEMNKAREEMQKAKAELDKAREELKKAK